MGEFGPICGHAVGAFDCTEGDGVVVGTFVAHYAYGLDGEEDAEGLPDFVVVTAVM